MSSGAPAPHAANDGEASSPLSRIASFVRSAGGKNWSRSNTPSLRIGGCWIWPTSVGRSSAAPCDHECWIRLASRMCSRLDSGSASMPTSAEQARHVARRSRRRRPRRRSVAGTCSEPTMLSGHARLRARRVDREVGGVAQGARSARARSPSRPGRPSTSSPAAAAKSSGVAPAALAWPSSIHGRKSAGARSGNVRHRLREVALGVDEQRRQPGRSTSSMSTTPRPVLPEPVMPTITPWVVKSAASSSTSSRRCARGTPGRRARRGTALPCGPT